MRARSTTTIVVPLSLNSEKKKVLSNLSDLVKLY